jgi:hypothetical protein
MGVDADARVTHPMRAAVPMRARASDARDVQTTWAFSRTPYATE